MKCSICGYRAKDIGAIGKHYRKKHPKRMSRGRKEHKDYKSDSDLIYRILKKEGLI